MTRAQAEAAVWRAFPHRSPRHWNLTLSLHHTSTRSHPVWRWHLEGMSTRQDRLERRGFVDASGVEVET